MNPNDARHGTDRGYRAGCRERCCLDGTALYERRRSKLKAMGRDGRLDPTISRRKIGALQALGWTHAHIAEAGGFSFDRSIQRIARESTAWVFIHTAAKVNAAYDKLHMTPGPSHITADRAKRAGHHPPLAWNNIDDPNDQPDLGVDDDPDFVDEVLIQRAMSGQRVDANKAERLEITRRWKEASRSLNDLERIQGRWNVRRLFGEESRMNEPAKPMGGAA